MPQLDVGVTFLLNSAPVEAGEVTGSQLQSRVQSELRVSFQKTTSDALSFNFSHGN
jgi:hypothetical protein